MAKPKVLFAVEIAQSSRRLAPDNEIESDVRNIRLSATSMGANNNYKGSNFIDACCGNLRPSAKSSLLMGRYCQTCANILVLSTIETVECVQIY